MFKQTRRVTRIVARFVGIVAMALAAQATLSPAVYGQLGRVPMQISVMRADGTQPRPLVHVEGRLHHGSPSWSPDGEQIAFDAYRDDLEDPTIFICDADGSELQRFTQGAVPRWSPDGKQIAFYSGLSENPEVFLTTLEGMDRRKLSDGGFPAWSPDGEHITFAQMQPNHGIWVTRPDGTGQRRILQRTDDILGLAWSPDGQRIAFSAAMDRHFYVYVMRTDGSGLMRLTESGNCLYPRWSPDSKRLAYVRYEDGFNDADVWVVSADGSVPPTALTAEPGYQIDPSWSADGKQILYASQR